MKYYLLLYGLGEGCDYTIGCNQLILRLEAESPEAAMQQAWERIDAHGGESLSNITRAILIPVHGPAYGCELDINAERKRRADQAAEETRQVKEQAEREQYERLKAKFE